MREKIEIGGVGEFDGCRTTEEVIEALLTHHKSPAAALAELDELRSMIEHYASTHARPVLVAEPARSQAPGSELAQSLALPARKGRR